MLSENTRPKVVLSVSVEPLLKLRTIVAVTVDGGWATTFEAVTLWTLSQKLVYPDHPLAWFCW